MIKIISFRYILSINVFDHTGSQWLTCFNEVAERLLNIKAKDLQELKGKSDNDVEFNKYFDAVNFRQYDFRIRAKIDNYNVCSIIIK